MFNSAKPFLAYAAGALVATVFWNVVTLPFARNRSASSRFPRRSAWAAVFVGVLVTSLTLVIRVWNDFTGEFLHLHLAVPAAMATRSCF